MKKFEVTSFHTIEVKKTYLANSEEEAYDIWHSEDDLDNSMESYIYSIDEIEDEQETSD